MSVFSDRTRSRREKFRRFRVYWVGGRQSHVSVFSVKTRSRREKVRAFRVYWVGGRRSHVSVFSIRTRSGGQRSGSSGYGSEEDTLSDEKSFSLPEQGQVVKVKVVRW